MRKVPERGFKRMVNHDVGVYARFQVCSCGEAFCTIKVHCSLSLLMAVPLSTSGEWAPEDHPAVVLLKSCGVLQAIGDAMKAHGWHGNGSVVPTTEFKEMNEVSRQWFNVVELVWGSSRTIHLPPTTPQAEIACREFWAEWEWMSGTTPSHEGPDVMRCNWFATGPFWLKRRKPRNQCKALVRAGHWDPPFGERTKRF